MKPFAFFISLVMLAGCSSPQAPSSQGTTIPGLSIPDTIDFGVVRAGIMKDTNVIFKNTGTDTVQITSQGFSDTAFKLVTPSLKQFNLAPGAEQQVGISFLVADTSSAVGLDSIRSSSNRTIMVLRGEAIPFSSFFPSAPTSVTVALTGVIGTYNSAEAGQTIDYLFRDKYRT